MLKFSCGKSGESGADVVFIRIAIRRQLLGLLAMAVVLAVVAVGVFLARFLHPVLAINQRALGARVLVVEGWLPSRAMAAAVEEFRRGSYERVYTIGVPYRSEFEPGARGSYATSGADKLIDLGLPPSMVVAVSSGVTLRNRSFVAAGALHDYFQREGVVVRSVNVLTQGAHARRSRLCLQRALGPDVVVGVISIENPSYDPGRWWMYSEGLKEVLGELVGYVHGWFTLRGNATADGSTKGGHHAAHQ